MWELIAPVQHEITVKKSRFICHAAPVDSIDAAMSFLQRVRDDTATHNCYAWRIGRRCRFFDDSEPKGTAGRPILVALDGQEVINAIVVVVRFFGGIKLGAGGLTRAYGRCAATCLGQSPKRPVRDMDTITVTIPFDQVGNAYYLLQRFDIGDTHQTYVPEGIRLVMSLPVDCKASFVKTLKDITAGRMRVS